MCVFRGVCKCVCVFVSVWMWSVCLCVCVFVSVWMWSVCVCGCGVCMSRCVVTLVQVPESTDRERDPDCDKNSRVLVVLSGAI